MDKPTDSLALMLGFYEDFKEGESAVSIFMGEREIGQWWLNGRPPLSCCGQGDSVGEAYGFLVDVGDNSTEAWHGGVALDSLTKSFHRPKWSADLVAECLTVEIDGNMSDRGKFVTHVVV